MQRGFGLLCLVLMLAVAAQADSGKGPPAKGAPDDYEIVKTARQFVIGGVGVSASISGEETAFRQLLKQAEPLAQCQKLLTEATPAGQLYGLLGLHLLHQQAFEKAIPNYRDSKTAIDSIGGCIHFRTTAGVVAKQIENGELR